MVIVMTMVAVMMMVMVVVVDLREAMKEEMKWDSQMVEC